MLPGLFVVPQYGRLQVLGVTTRAQVNTGFGKAWVSFGPCGETHDLQSQPAVPDVLLALQDRAEEARSSSLMHKMRNLSGLRARKLTGKAPRAPGKLPALLETLQRIFTEDKGKSQNLKQIMRKH